MFTQEYMEKVVKDVGEDDDFKSESWVSATDYVNDNGGIVSGCLGDIKFFLKNGKLDQVVAIVKSCSPNMIDDLTVIMKDLSDNERTKTIALRGELHFARKCDLTIDAYFAKIESITTLLSDLGSHMHEDDLVTYAIDGFGDRFTI
nr:hypothetical protein [Tanacetum cinerariifolium]